MRRALLCGLSAALLAVSLPAQGAVVFEDHFDNPGTSDGNWLESSDEMTKNFEGGVCTIENKSSGGGILYTTLATKPSTFTFSAKITRTSENVDAGLFFCLSINGAVKGYSIHLGNHSNIYLYRNGTGDPRDTLPIFDVASSYMTANTNTLKVSKIGTKYNVFCNDQFVTTFTDELFSTGDIALLIPKSSSVVFDDVVVTDQFTEGTKQTCFKDDFDDGDQTGWGYNWGQENINNWNGGVRFQTENGGQKNMYVSLNLVNFVAKTEVSFRGGNKQKNYGLMLVGTAEPGQSIPMAWFTITGSSYFGAYSKNGTSLTKNTAIKGDPYISSTGDTTYYVDTLKVVKTQGSDDYVFYVNNVALDTLKRNVDIDFDVSNVGLYCSDSLDVVFDNFSAGEGDGSCATTIMPLTKRIRNNQLLNTQNFKLFDPMGRLSITGRFRLATCLFLRVYT